MKIIKPIIIVSGEPNSIFSEILSKTFTSYKNSKPIVLICSQDLLDKQLQKLNLKLDTKKVEFKKNKLSKLSLNKINIIDIEYKFNKPFENISLKSKKYIENCFKKFIEIAKFVKIAGLINGPISKEYFLKNTYPGITEYLSNKFKVKNKYCMLIYNRSLSVTPITTHLPISKVSKKIKKKDIIIKSLLISNFYKKVLSKKPKIAVTGLNPHCENFFYKSEEKKIIEPAIKYLQKKNIKIKALFQLIQFF